MLLLLCVTYFLHCCDAHDESRLGPIGMHLLVGTVKG